MVRIGADFRKLAEVKPSQWATRFAFGCALTLVFSLTSKWAGPVIGGLFLAFPGIYSPGSSFVEKQEEKRKSEAGVHGTVRARTLASAHAVGASAGTIGLLAFSTIAWLGLPRYGLAKSLIVAAAAWFAVSFAAWAIRERF